MQLFLSPDFNIRSLCKKPKSLAQKLKELSDKIQSHRLTEIGRVFDSFIPQRIFDSCERSDSRRRIFSSENTFWGFFAQTMQADGSCQSVVHQFRIDASKQDREISVSTSAYCQARKRLPYELLDSVFNYSANLNEKVHPLVGRRVVSADGTGLLAADTKANQMEWPQQANQRAGCAFPQLRLCTLFNLHSGVALSYKLGNKKSHELPLLRAQEEHFKKGDIFIGDKGFTCFYDQARLLGIGVDSIVSLSRRKPFTVKTAEKKITSNDLLVSVPKFTSTVARSRYPKDRWNALPDSIKMRQIEVNFNIPGYRSEKVYLLTTLLDEKKYPAETIANLYKERWEVEVFFRDLKTTLGMEFLKSKSPDMVKKEIKMYFIVFNVIRQLIAQSKSTGKIAFKSAVQTIDAYCSSISIQRRSVKYLKDLVAKISCCVLHQRPERIEPRCVKRRPKPFKLMTKPRSDLSAELMA